MKARYLRPGNTIEGWTVTAASKGSVVDANNHAHGIVTLELEKAAHEYDDCLPVWQPKRSWIETRRTWMFAGEEVT